MNCKKEKDKSNNEGKKIGEPIYVGYYKSLMITGIP